MRYLSVCTLCLIAILAFAAWTAAAPAALQPFVQEPYTSRVDAGSLRPAAIVDASTTPATPEEPTAPSDAAPAATSPPEGSNVTFRNETWHYAITYPDTWEVDDRGEVVAFAASSPPAVVVVYAERASDTYSASETDAEVLQAESNAVPNELEQSYGDFNLTDEVYYPSGVAPIHEYQYTGTLDDGTAVRGDTLVFVHEGSIYTIEYIAAVDNYDYRAAEFAGMLQSFEFV